MKRADMKTSKAHAFGRMGAQGAKSAIRAFQQTGQVLQGLAFILPVIACLGAAAQDTPPSPDCDPRVAAALAAAAEAGVQADFQVIRHAEQGIRKTDSILDLSCVWDMFDYRGFNILHDPGAALDRILNLARKRLCSEARNVYNRHVGRRLDARVFTGAVRDIPGTRTVRRNVIEDAGIGREQFRRLFGGTAQ